MARAPRYAAALLVALTAVGCSAGSSGTTSAAPAPRPTATFTDSGVTVSMSLGKWDGTNGTATVTLTPQRAGFHVYSVDLPPDGVDGLGRPTSVKLDGALTLAGKPATASQVRKITVPGVQTELPVYPDGPVTLDVPLTAKGAGEATALISYAACSETDGCLMPVDDHPVALVVNGKDVVLR